MISLSYLYMLREISYVQWLSIEGNPQQSNEINLPISFATRKICALVSDYFASSIVPDFNGLYGIESESTTTSQLNLIYVSCFQLQPDLTTLIREYPQYFWAYIIGY